MWIEIIILCAVAWFALASALSERLSGQSGAAAVSPRRPPGVVEASPRRIPIGAVCEVTELHGPTLRKVRATVVDYGDAPEEYTLATDDGAEFSVRAQARPKPRQGTRHLDNRRPRRGAASRR